MTDYKKIYETTATNTGGRDCLISLGGVVPKFWDRSCHPWPFSTSRQGVQDHRQVLSYERQDLKCRLSTITIAENLHFYPAQNLQF